MAYPPPTLPINRTNALPQLDTHPNDHNAVNGAVNDLNAHAQAVDGTLATHGTTINDHNQQLLNIQGDVAIVTTDANGGSGFNTPWEPTGSIGLTLSTQNPALMEVCLTIYNVAGTLVAFTARHGNGTPVASASITVHWMVVS